MNIKFTLLFLLIAFFATAQNSVPLGQSSNIYSVLENNHMLDYNAETNSIVFIHRADPGLNPENGNTSSQFNLDISFSAGSNWSENKLNVGPLNSNPGQNEPNGQARYLRLQFIIRREI